MVSHLALDKRRQWVRREYLGAHSRLLFAAGGNCILEVTYSVKCIFKENQGKRKMGCLVFLLDLPCASACVSKTAYIYSGDIISQQMTFLPFM